MNKTKIEWTDYTWNPITGCKHECFYCYAKKLFTRFGKSFEPTFYPERLEELKKLKKPAKIFVCSVADLFAEWTPGEWRYAVLDEIEKPKYNHLTFQLLTKNPENIRVRAKDNIWIGATITKQSEMQKAYDLVFDYEGKKFLSFEPILERIDIAPVKCINAIDWIIVGKLTGSRKVELDLDWINLLIEETREANIPIFLKNNINWHIKIQEFPK